METAVDVDAATTLQNVARQSGLDWTYMRTHRLRHNNTCVNRSKSPHFHSPRLDLASSPYGYGLAVRMVHAQASSLLPADPIPCTYVVLKDGDTIGQPGCVAHADMRLPPCRSIFNVRFPYLSIYGDY